MTRPTLPHTRRNGYSPITHQSQAYRRGLLYPYTRPLFVGQARQTTPEWLSAALFALFLVFIVVLAWVFGRSQP